VYYVWFIGGLSPGFEFLLAFFRSRTSSKTDSQYFQRSTQIKRPPERQLSEQPKKAAPALKQH
jgi:hypothetical protein